MASVAEEFTEFAETAGGRLRRTAFMLCGDWHQAEDLTQTALAKVFASWRRIGKRDSVQVYATRTLINTYLTDKRARRSTEIVTSWLPERPAESPGPELRLVVLDALATLTPKARSVLVLRYWQDLSVNQVAQMLGCSPGNVKSQSSRALHKLRPLLGDLLPQAGQHRDLVSPSTATSEVLNNG